MSVDNETPTDIQLRLHCDTHGSWVEVPRLMLMLIDMPVCGFSKFSYVNEQSMFLDEYLDGHKFIARFEMFYGEKPNMVVVDHGEAALLIRAMPKNLEGTEVTIH